MFRRQNLQQQKQEKKKWKLGNFLIVATKSNGMREILRAQWIPSGMLSLHACKIGCDFTEESDIFVVMHVCKLVECTKDDLKNIVNAATFEYWLSEQQSMDARKTMLEYPVNSPEYNENEEYYKKYAEHVRFLDMDEFENARWNAIIRTLAQANNPLFRRLHAYINNRDSSVAEKKK